MQRKINTLRIIAAGSICLLALVSPVAAGPIRVPLHASVPVPVIRHDIEPTGNPASTDLPDIHLEIDQINQIHHDHNPVGNTSVPDVPLVAEDHADRTDPDLRPHTPFPDISSDVKHHGVFRASDDAHRQPNYNFESNDFTFYDRQLAENPSFYAMCTIKHELDSDLHHHARFHIQNAHDEESSSFLTSPYNPFHALNRASRTLVFEVDTQSSATFTAENFHFQ